jgi:ribosomal subunit interface protein
MHEKKAMPQLEISFRNMQTSAAAEKKIRQYADKLAKFHDRIIYCKVVIEQKHHHQQHGNIFHVRITLQVPGSLLIVSRDPEANHGHEDIYVAIHDAFDAARRQLEDHARLARGDVKTHRADAKVGKQTDLDASEKGM